MPFAAGSSAAKLKQELGLSNERFGTIMTTRPPSQAYGLPGERVVMIAEA